MTRALPTRAEVDRRFTWNSASVFPDTAAFDAAADTIIARLPDLGDFKGHLSTSSDTLADWLDTAEKLQRLMAKVTVYTSMEYSCDAGDQDAVARADRARSTSGRLSAAMSF